VTAVLQTASNAKALAPAVMVISQVMNTVNVSKTNLEVLASGYIPNSNSKVALEIISGVPYSAPAKQVTLEVIAQTTQIPQKPMQRIVWFMPN
jgi:hypothetical protein